MPKPDPLPAEFQKNGHDCGITAWRCVFRYHYARNAKVIDLSNPIQGTDPSTLEALIRRDANWCVNSGETFISDLEHFAATLRPSICLMTFDNDTDSHYVVCGGVWRGKVYFHDPAEGWRTLPVKEFERMWHGVGKYAHFARWSLTAWPRH